jgi:hypothetical protein
MLELHKLKKEERLDALGKIVALRRSEAVAARKESGIERVWKEDEEYYLGIDDANRATATYTKSPDSSGGLSSAGKSTGNRCTAFFNATRQFVDSAAARMGDILLPAGDWNFSIRATPVPDLIDVKSSTQPVVSQTGPVAPNPDGTPYTVGQFAKEEISDADARAQKAEVRIRDWLTECNYHTEVRKVIDLSAMKGTGIIRGAFPTVSKVRSVSNGELTIKYETKPGSKQVDCENFFPDPNCGDNIQNGEFCIERDYFTARQLRGLMDDPSYMANRIQKVLEEGVDDSNKELNKDTKDSDRFPVWYYFGNIDIEDLKCMPKSGADDNTAGDMVPAVVVMVNNTVIKGHLAPLDNDEFPYDIMAWQRVPGSIWGIGVARQARVPQDMLNASARALMNNAGLSSAPQIVVRRSAVRPSDGEWSLLPGKIWFTTEEADTRSVSDAFTSVVIPSMQAELSANIQLAMKFMEDATGVSFMLQGQQGSAPDTVGGMTLLHNNASSLLRRIARVFDESVTEPHIRRYYDWLLIHGEDDEKGDLHIEAIGSTALVEREIQSQQAAQILQMSLNPIFEMSPKKAKDELLRSWRFDPKKFDLSEEEKQAAKQQQPAPAPAVQAAQIRAASAEKIAAANAVHDQQTTAAELDHDEQIAKMDTDRDTVYVQAQTARDQMTYQSRIDELQLRERLAMMDYANKHQITLDNVKAKLSETVMKLNVQKQLAAADMHSKTPVITPPVEIPGRAQVGHAYEQ